MSFRSLFSIVFGFGLIVSCFVGLYSDFRYAALGVNADGFVSNAWQTTSKGGPVYHTAYYFKADGNWLNGTDTGPEHWRGDKVPVVYIPSDPTTSRMTSSHAFFPLGLLEFLLGCFMIGSLSSRDEAETLVPQDIRVLVATSYPLPRGRFAAISHAFHQDSFD